MDDELESSGFWDDLVDREENSDGVVHETTESVELWVNTDLADLWVNGVAHLIISISGILGGFKCDVTSKNV